MFRQSLKGFLRGWSQHKGVQFATLTVMAASFVVVTTVVTIFYNLDRVLSFWGDSVQMTVYLEPDLEKVQVSNVKKYLKDFNEFSQIQYVSQESALKNFEKQMQAYAPDLLEDPEFVNILPNSFIATLSNKASLSHENILRDVSEKILKFEGIEDVTFGQDWVNNYSTFMETTVTVGWLIVILLLIGIIFVVGNSIRASIMHRREEVEVLELVGATRFMIRAPFVGEGAIIGFISTLFGIGISFLLYGWMKDLLVNKLSFLALSQHMSFLSIPFIILLLTVGVFLGALGSYVCVLNLNDGWSASRRKQKAK